MKERELTPTEGKTLRYLVARFPEPVKPSQATNKISWSDIPHSYLEALGVMERLRKWGYAEKMPLGYVATEKGRKRIARANKNKEWQAPPPPSVTNRSYRDYQWDK